MSNAEVVRDVEELLKDRMFLSMVLLDPRKALKSYGFAAKNEDAVVAIEKAAEGEASHWAEVLREVSQVKWGGIAICNFCKA